MKTQMEWLTQQYEKAKSVFQKPANDAVSAVGPLPTPPGVAPEASGTTVTGGKKVGGRRHRRTMKGSKKSRKTYRRKH